PLDSLPPKVAEEQMLIRELNREHGQVHYGWSDSKFTRVGYINTYPIGPPHHALIIPIYRWMKDDDDLSSSLTGLRINPATFAASVSSTNAVQNYTYLNTLLDGDINIVNRPGVVDSDIEVGSGGTAEIVDSAASDLYLWHAKNVVWNNLSAA